MNREFANNAILLVVVNLLVKSFYLFGIDRTVQNVLPPGEYGLYFTLVNFVFLFQIVADFGLQQYNLRHLSQSRQLLGKYFPHFLALKLLLGISYLLLVSLAGWAWGFPPNSWALLVVIGLNQFLQTLVFFLRSNLAGLGLYRLDSLASILDRGLLILIAGSLLWWPPWGEQFQLWWFVLAQTLAYTLAAGGLLALLRPRLDRVLRRPRRPFVGALLRASAPYALAVFLMTLYLRIDAVMIARFHPDGLTENDHYAAAYRLLDAANLAGFLLAGLLLPMFARLIKERENPAPLIRLSLSTLWVGAISLAASAWWLATPIMEGLYTNGDAYSGQLLQWLMLTFVPLSGGYVYGTLLVAAGELRELNRLYLAGVIFNILLNAWLIPRWGALGAAVATFLTQSGIFAAQLGLSYRRLSLPLNLSLVIRFVFYAAAVSALAYGWLRLAGPVHWLVKFAGSVCTGGLLAFVFQLLDLKSWLRWLAKDEARAGK